MHYLIVVALPPSVLHCSNV